MDNQFQNNQNLNLNQSQSQNFQHYGQYPQQMQQNPPQIRVQNTKATLIFSIIGLSPLVGCLIFFLFVLYTGFMAKYNLFPRANFGFLFMFFYMGTISASAVSFIFSIISMKRVARYKEIYSVITDKNVKIANILSKIGVFISLPLLIFSVTFLFLSDIFNISIF